MDDTPDMDKGYKINKKTGGTLKELDDVMGRDTYNVRFSLNNPKGRIKDEELGSGRLKDFSIDIIDGEPKVRLKPPSRNTILRIRKYILREQDTRDPETKERIAREAREEKEAKKEKKEEPKEEPKPKKKIKFKVKEQAPEEKKRFRRDRPKIDDEELRAKVLERMARIKRKPPVPPKPRRLRDDVYRIPQKGRAELLEQIRSRRLEEQPAPPRKDAGDRVRAVRSDKGKDHKWKDGRENTETYKRNEGVDWSRVRCKGSAGPQGGTTCWNTTSRRTDATGEEAYKKNVGTRHYIKQLRRKKYNLRKGQV